ncbi:ewing's tumor-associated antigen 1 homolog [Danio aesculapii]|uniref:ewing's tumor-associated antigen 1 homolog n=1 Tax=Danio aesculapii TaxID=1142201 RepID=UPI0024C099DA|nr:ewing's tumor-associated antigen 1 homolog [Danio aesculapii]
MSDYRNIGVRQITDARESRSRTFKVAPKKMKTKRHMIGFKQSQSPSCHNSHNCRKDFTTPKRRPRVRFNGSYGGDSPNETESLQDIIWDPNSPTQDLNGQGDGRVIEISEIVNRIAPTVEKAKDGDSVLQWIGDSAIACTPEIRQPRVRRISTRQSNVEDLKKLAKQFDISMTRQDKEKEQKSTEGRNKLNKLQSDGAITMQRSTSNPVLSAQLTDCSSLEEEEQELQALFDGPTQHVSGRLSPPSVNSTPENKTEPVAQAELRMSSAATNFDDDWENDDLLNDSFVLEMTQNPVPMNVAQKRSTARPEPSTKKCSFVTKINQSNARSICTEGQQSTSKSSTFTKTLPNVKASNQSTFRPKPSTSANNQNTEKLLKTAPVNQANQQACSSQDVRKGVIDEASKSSGASSQASSCQFDGVSEEDMKSLFDSDGLWNDEDDDLLFKVCDDVEKLSASQEQQKLAHESKSSASKAPSSSNTIGQQQEPTKSTRVFARSNSVPCTSNSSGFKLGYSVLPTSESSSSGSGNQSAQYYGHAQNKSDLAHKTVVRAMGSSETGGNTSKSHYTFKRHLSDSMTLSNKVFISSHATPKCSAAEIERKKQEAIARRRLRMQASQKHGAPT